MLANFFFFFFFSRTRTGSRKFLNYGQGGKMTFRGKIKMLFITTQAPRKNQSGPCLRLAFTRRHAHHKVHMSHVRPSRLCQFKLCSANLSVRNVVHTHAFVIPTCRCTYKLLLLCVHGTCQLITRKPCFMRAAIMRTWQSVHVSLCQINVYSSTGINIYQGQATRDGMPPDTPANQRRLIESWRTKLWFGAE